MEFCGGSILYRLNPRHMSYCWRSCRLYGSHRAIWAGSCRSRMYLPLKYLHHEIEIDLMCGIFRTPFVFYNTGMQYDSLYATVYRTVYHTITPPWGDFPSSIARRPRACQDRTVSSRRHVSHRRPFRHRHYSKCGDIDHRTSARVRVTYTVLYAQPIWLFVSFQVRATMFSFHKSPMLRQRSTCVCWSSSLDHVGTSPLNWL